MIKNKMRKVAIIASAQSGSERKNRRESTPELIYRVTKEALKNAGLTRDDIDTVVASIKKTNYGLIVCQAPATGCFGEHIAFEINKHAFDYLDGPIELVAAPDVPPPMAPTLEKAFMPDAEKVRARVRAMLGK